MVYGRYNELVHGDYNGLYTNKHHWGGQILYIWGMMTRGLGPFSDSLDP